MNRERMTSCLRVFEPQCLRRRRGFDHVTALKEGTNRIVEARVAHGCCIFAVGILMNADRPDTRIGGSKRAGESEKGNDWEHCSVKC